MKEINVKQTFKFAENGHTVKRIKTGNQKVSDRCAAVAKRNGYTKQAKMPENKAMQAPKNKEFPKESGAGWFELSNGKKVRGKENAIEAQKELE